MFWGIFPWKEKNCILTTHIYLCYILLKKKSNGQDLILILDNLDRTSGSSLLLKCWAILLASLNLFESAIKCNE